MNKITEAQRLIKQKGQVFTPSDIVIDMLDKVRYYGKKILTQTIIDNSCGNGNFLIMILERFCKTFLKYDNNQKKLQQKVEKLIFGIELDPLLWKQCWLRLDETGAKYGLKNVKWQVYQKDALKGRKFDGRMDYVVGNPPYVRIHNLTDRTRLKKQFRFCRKGACDLFLAFYEIGLKMLKPTGRLCYISPNSYLKSVAGEALRTHLIKNRLIVSLTDLGWQRVFPRYNLYPTIIVVKKKKQTRKSFVYENFRQEKQRIFFKDFIDEKTKKVKELIFNRTVRMILEKRIKEPVLVKNGFATLNDRVFLQQKKEMFGFNEPLIKCLKASTGKWYECFFPYKANGSITWEELKKNQNVEAFLERHRASLDKKTKDSAWYLFGRSQGIKDVFQNQKRLAINNLIRTTADIKLKRLDIKVGIFSGYYIIFNDERLERDIKKLIYSAIFINFVHGLGFYKQKGFYFFRSKDLQNFINYELHKKRGKQNAVNA